MLTFMYLMNIWSKRKGEKDVSKSSNSKVEYYTLLKKGHSSNTFKQFASKIFLQTLCSEEFK